MFIENSFDFKHPNNNFSPPNSFLQLNKDTKEKMSPKDKPPVFEKISIRQLTDSIFPKILVSHFF
jgi:hypothetical protein